MCARPFFKSYDPPSHLGKTLNSFFRQGSGLLIEKFSLKEVFVSQLFRRQPGYLRQVINLTQTTSGSYLLLSSLDLSRKNLALHGAEIFQKVVDLAQYARVQAYISATNVWICARTFWRTGTFRPAEARR